jgi:peptidoglycan L-alanyl-D-glutamate endopeptidase CwlK
LEGKILLLAVALYFVLACFLSWVALFPAGREWVAGIVARAVAGLQSGAGKLARRESARAGTIGQATGDHAGSALDFVRRHYVFFIGGALIICIPPVLALIIGNNASLGGYEESTREANTQVAALLQGEQLVPPVALPPLVFATQEVEALRPMLVSASRNWALLNPDFTQRLLTVFKIMKEKHGYDMAILEGYRSPERQNLLAGMGKSVTNAAAFQSWHQYGLAADCAFLRDGKLVISEKDPWAMRGYQLYGEVAESVGMTWGGRWKMMDFGHTELRVAGVMKKP